MSATGTALSQRRSCENVARRVVSRRRAFKCTLPPSGWLGLQDGEQSWHALYRYRAFDVEADHGERELGFRLDEITDQGPVAAHLPLHGAERVFCKLAPLLHPIGVGCRPLVHRFAGILMNVAGDPAVCALGALRPQGAAATGRGRITLDLAFFRDLTTAKRFSRRASPAVARLVVGE